MKYITHHEKGSACIFCTAVQQEDGPGNLIVARGQHAFAILNRYPYTSGHLMVVPYVHRASIEELTPDIRSEIMELVTHAMQVMREVYHPDAFNIGANIGAAAGAGVAGHVHFHVVPRWMGDNNFMSTVADTRVIPENLPDTLQRLADAWDSI